MRWIRSSVCVEEIQLSADGIWTDTAKENGADYACFKLIYSYKTLLMY